MIVSFSSGSALKIAWTMRRRPGILFTARNGFKTLNALKLVKETPPPFEFSESSIDM